MESVLGSIKYGVLLPVTSRRFRAKEDCLVNLENFAKSLKETTTAEISKVLDHGSQRFELKVYVGVDESDAFLLTSRKVENVLVENGIENAETMVFTYPPGSLCAIWRGLARRAYEDKCHYTVRLGDDVVLKTPGWMSSFHKASTELESKRGVPRGFGCIAFSDTPFPGFPAFLVMGQTHFAIFGGEVIPEAFVYQDGDQYLFQLYRRWGCSVMLQDVFLENTMGGSRETRHREKHHHEWSLTVLDEGVAKVRQWLTEHESLSQGLPLEILTLDVIVPTFRAPLEGIEKIINLKRSVTCSTMIIIIVDNPLSPNVSELKKRYEHDAFIRISVNDSNCGASETRNLGLAESTADYVLFLDEDAIPDPDILLESEKVIGQYPKACGFIGDTKFADAASSVISSSVVLSGVTILWGITKHLSEEIPWGVTANLLVRRGDDDVSFDVRFPKSGGGEDIDFCLRKRKAHLKMFDNGEGFRGAPKMVVTHPNWNDGRRSFNLFRSWGIGDGALVKMYPHLAYVDIAPNSAETLLLAISFSIVAAAVHIVARFANTRWISIQLVRLLLLSIAEVVVANVLYDIHWHVSIDKDHNLPGLRGIRRILAAGESAVVRMFSEWGRLEGMIARREWSWIGWRFDWFAGRFEEIPLNAERQRTLGRFHLWLMFLIITIVCSSICF